MAKLTKKVRVRISFEDFRPSVTMDVNEINEIHYPIGEIEKITVILFNRDLK